MSQKGLAERISSYLVGSRAYKTTIKYNSTLNCCERGYIYLPANPIHVTVYLSDLLDQRVSYGVIAAAFYAIKWVHNINNYHDPTENGFVKSLLDAAKKVAFKSSKAQGRNKLRIINPAVSSLHRKCETNRYQRFSYDTNWLCGLVTFR